ncbi:MAG TPA: hypothetical protein VFH80_08160, partial [Solirubrobacteraceae bacterium]|nr:hypothetical protein [Solirubrobacteraceae bacterium]
MHNRFRVLFCGQRASASATFGSPGWTGVIAFPAIGFATKRHAGGPGKSGVTAFCLRPSRKGGLSGGGTGMSGMPQNFLDCDREQAFLMPPSLRDWLPEDHL